MSRRRNPNWGKSYVLVPSRLSESEQRVEELSFRPGEQPHVPEDLLRLQGVQQKAVQNAGSLRTPELSPRIPLHGRHEF
jgi:hypothetical protein